MLFEIYFSLMEYFCENMGYLFSFLFFFSFLLWTSFVSVFYILYNPCLFLEQLLREILSRTQSIYSDKTQQTYFLSSPSVGAKHFKVDEEHVFAYFQYRSNTYMWRVRDLDFGNMINLPTRVNKTRQNSIQSKQLMWMVFNETNIWLWQKIQHH